MTLFACYGCACPVHAQCARYHAVESAGFDLVVLATCETPDHRRPGFRQLDTGECVPKQAPATENEGADCD